METSVILVFISFIWLALAWKLRKIQSFHIPAMFVLIVFDLCFPIYLYLTHDWWQRLIVEGEAFSFLIWSHLILVLVLYALYVLQVLAGRKMVHIKSGHDYEAYRDEHHKQFLGILIIRILVFTSGALLIVPTTPTH